MPRRILAAVVSCSVVAAACVDDISSTSGDKLSATEFASMSAALDELVIATIMGFGSPWPTMQSLVANSVVPLYPYPYVRTTTCPAGGFTTHTYWTTRSDPFAATEYVTSTVTEKVTDCAVAWADGMTWTFASSRLDWKMKTERREVLSTFDGTVTGGLYWSGGGKRGGCLVNLTLREQWAFDVSDTLSLRGQACGAFVDLVIGYR